MPVLSQFFLTRHARELNEENMNEYLKRALETIVDLNDVIETHDLVASISLNLPIVDALREQILQENVRTIMEEIKHHLGEKPTLKAILDARRRMPITPSRAIFIKQAFLSILISVATLGTDSKKEVHRRMDLLVKYHDDGLHKP